MRKLFAFLLLLMLLYGAGFVVFIQDARRFKAEPEKADAIVVLTGGGERLIQAVKLLEQGYGARLLISGVDLSATKSDLKQLSGGDKAFECCADLGFTAADTHGNAEETAEWAQEKNYRSLLIVTANYHMRRTLTEFSALMPQIRLTPYAVRPDARAFPEDWRNPQWVKLLHIEYAKFLASFAMNRALYPLWHKVTG